METVSIEQDVVRATSPEGQTASMPLPDFLSRLAPERPDSGGIVLPDGVKCLLSNGDLLVLVHETVPQVRNLKWISRDSVELHGSGVEYREVSVSLPYVIVLAVFQSEPAGGYRVTSKNECFFRTAPLASLDDELLYPALLNCSRFRNDPQRPLSWICTQYLKRKRRRGASDSNSSLRTGLEGLLEHLLDSGFNLSSEHHEGSSWFTETVKAKVDPRIASIETWEDTTKKDPLFAMDVPWLPTGKSVRQVAKRILAANSSGSASPRTAADLARIIFNGESVASGDA